MTKYVDSTIEGSIAIITIDNPPVNAFHPDVAEALVSEFDRLEAIEPKLRSVVLTGAGKFFMAGGDIRHFQTLDAVSSVHYARRIQIIQEKILHFHCPVIAAVNGTALGGGCELMMSCDIRVVSRDALFGLPEVTLGIIPAAGGTQNLPRLVSRGAAKRLLFTADRIPADEALSLGLVDFVVPAGDVLKEARALATRIAANAPLAVHAAKKAVNLGMELGLSEALRFEAEIFGQLFHSADVKEGVSAFVEKRKAKFSGK